MKAGMIGPIPSYDVYRQTTDTVKQKKGIFSY
jgi:hypothetical protein